MRQSKRNAAAGLGGCLLAVAGGLLLLPASRAEASLMQDIAGRWTGWGTINLAGGSREQVKCVATYFVEDGGKGLKQNLRCASSSYKIDATSQLALNGSSVSGTWSELTYAKTGAVSGQVTGGGFNLSIKGDAFTAAMNIASSNCKQSVNIRPQGLDVTSVAISLSKC